MSELETETLYGYLKINFDGVDPDDSDLQHIAEQIEDGFTSGEIIQEHEVDGDE